MGLEIWTTKSGLWNAGDVHISNDGIEYVLTEFIMRAAVGSECFGQQAYIEEWYSVLKPA